MNVQRYWGEADLDYRRTDLVDKMVSSVPSYINIRDDYAFLAQLGTFTFVFSFAPVVLILIAQFYLPLVDDWLPTIQLHYAVLSLQYTLSVSYTHLTLPTILRV